MQFETSFRHTNLTVEDTTDLRPDFMFSQVGSSFFNVLKNTKSRV